jgi:hypothetical protein
MEKQSLEVCNWIKKKDKKKLAQVNPRLGDKHVT